MLGRLLPWISIFFNETWITICCLTDVFSTYFAFAVLTGLDVKPYTFSYAELRAATDDFNPSNVVGEGGFGPVFKVIHKLEV